MSARQKPGGMKRHTVQRVAKMSGVSVRTLHYYDEIGLLKPAFIGANGYRYYEREQLLRLQQILFFRELGFPLNEIAATLAKPDFDRVETLRAHRKWLEAEADRYQRLLRTLDRTIDSLTAAPADDALFEGFSTEKQSEYEAYLIDHGVAADVIARSHANVKTWSKADFASMRAEMADIEASVSAAMAREMPADAPDVQTLIARHHQWVRRFWTPNRETYTGLGRLYVEHPDFLARYDRIRPGMAAYLRDAMTIYAAQAL
jgi:DNA-binding transcriptional MerR regulator